MSTPKKGPWYKQLWIPYIALPLLITVITMLSFVYLSFKHQDVVVQDDWDENSAAVNAAIDREHKAVALGLVLTLSADDASGDITLALAGKLPQPPATLELKISHPTDPARDQDLTLKREADGKYHATLSQALKGRYYLAVEAVDWRMTSMRTFPQGSFDIVAGQY